MRASSSATRARTDASPLSSPGPMVSSAAAVVNLRGGRRRDRRVHLYVMTPERALGEPAMDYLVALLRAYVSLGFDTEALLRSAGGGRP